MGTNYYWHPKRTSEERLHIGKSSHGWVFSLRIHPHQGIKDLGDWRKRWKTGRIENEYGEVIPVDAMMLTITARHHPHRLLRQGRDEDTASRIEPGELTYQLCDYEFS